MGSFGALKCLIRGIPLAALQAWWSRDDRLAAPPWFLLTRLTGCRCPLRVFDFYEFLTGVAHTLQLPPELQAAARFAFQFTRPRLVEFLFARERADREAVVQERRGVFPGELGVELADAVDALKHGRRGLETVAVPDPETAFFGFGEFGRPRQFFGADFDRRPAEGSATGRDAFVGDQPLDLADGRSATRRVFQITGHHVVAFD